MFSGHELFRRNGGTMPPGGFPTEEVWAMNTATVAEVEKAIAAMREERRDRDSEARRTAQEREAARLAEACRAAGVPERMLSVPIDARRVGAMAKGRGLWVFGPVGTGKTWAACAAIKGWASRGLGRARLVPVVAMLADLRDSIGSHGESSATAAYSQAPLLVLDDLDKEPPTPRTLSKLFEVIDTRYSHLRPTVVTSQRGPSELGAFLGSQGDAATAAAIVSRLRGSCDLAQTSGGDRRPHG